jgi:hypothetical protein
LALVVLALVVGLCTPLGGAAEPLAPLSGRFEVHRTGGGFELRGYRAEVGTRNTFVLEAGMPAAVAREQMQSVRWDESTGLRDPDSRRMRGVRVRYADVVEVVSVVLDAEGESVRTVAYSREPANYSREGLRRYLYAAFRDGRALVDREDRLVMAYGPRDGQVLRVEAVRLATWQPRWRLVHRMDAATAGERGESLPRGME